MEEKMKSYVCSVCGFIYKPKNGDPTSGIKPGTAFEDLPSGWVCPVCGALKELFVPIKEEAHVKAFTLSTCPYCKAFKRFMKEHNIPLEHADVDLLEGEEKKRVIREAYSYCRGCGFPIIIIGDVVIEGFDEPRLREVLGL
jgi:rubredoxin/glutaredoxin